MVAKCANQSCPAEFHRFLEGRVFVGEIRAIADEPLQQRYAWLCDKCSDRMTVVFDRESGEAAQVGVRCFYRQLLDYAQQKGVRLEYRGDSARVEG